MTPVIGHVGICPAVGLIVEVMGIHDNYFNAMYMTPGFKEGHRIGEVGKVQAFHGLEDQFIDVAESRNRFLQRWSYWLQTIQPTGTTEDFLASFAGVFHA